MLILRTIDEVRDWTRSRRSEGKRIGFVPTMGYLHDGHLSLVKAALRSNDTVIMSIFVNPTQFGVNEDFDAYPRDLSRDAALAEQAGAEAVFAPSAAEMYPEGYQTFVDVHGLTEGLCGAARPGHFKGVTTVVSKLFNITQPDEAFFGQKDAQQVAVIQRMTQDMNLPVRITVCPIVREPDGLAMSSRNIYLSADERQAALVLSATLMEITAMVNDGEHQAEKILSFARRQISAEPLAKIDYVECVDFNLLKPVTEISGRTLIALAVKFGNTRLIDNIILEV